MWKLYDIVYKDKQGPSQLTVDLDVFKWSSSIPVGFGNLNSKAYLAIKAITGCESISCKCDVFYLD